MEGGGGEGIGAGDDFLMCIVWRQPEAAFGAYLA